MFRCARGTPHQAMPVSPTVGWGELQAHRATQSWSLDLHPVAREKTSLAPCALSLKAYIIDQLFQGSPPLPLLVERCKNLLYTLTILNIIKLSRSLFSCSFFFFLQEGDSVNVNVTGPGATLALGLMFMKTNNSYVLNQ